jgi:hypothetical protein
VERTKEGFLYMGFLLRMLEEQPFRLLVRTIVKRLPLGVRTYERWDAVDRPQYLTGMLTAADLAREGGIDSIYVAEFGVARGHGLLAMQSYAQLIEKETGVSLKVVGFDTGSGLPPARGDFRDHPDKWAEGDYPMDEAWLRARLLPGSELILGDVRQTVPEFMKRQVCPLGFLAMDLDFYSSTKQALEILRLPNRQMLRRVFLYFDDIFLTENHRFAGERLAIEEFNSESEFVKIDRWYSLCGRIFRDLRWVQQMYVAHDLAAINNFHSKRAVQIV